MRIRTLALAGVFAGSLLLAACGDNTTDDVRPSDRSGSVGQADFNAQDMDFAVGMRAHHAQAVEMADIMLASNPTPEVAALAERIKEAQGPEIDKLDEMLESMGLEADSSSGHGTGHGADMPMHAGMMTDEQMQMLDDADGVEACRQFLTLMQEHHAGAIASAEKQLEDGSYEPALTLARQIRDSQSAEITEMQQLLAKL